jgi:hypothetical protein
MLLYVMADRRWRGFTKQATLLRGSFSRCPVLGRSRSDVRARTDPSLAAGVVAAHVASVFSELLKSVLASSG